MKTKQKGFTLSELVIVVGFVAVVVGGIGVGYVVVHFIGKFW